MIDGMISVMLVVVVVVIVTTFIFLAKPPVRFHFPGPAGHAPG